MNRCTFQRRGRPKITWLRTIDEDVQPLPQNFAVHTAWRKARDRDARRRFRISRMLSIQCGYGTRCKTQEGWQDVCGIARGLRCICTPLVTKSFTDWIETSTSCNPVIQI